MLGYATFVGGVYTFFKIDSEADMTKFARDQKTAEKPVCEEEMKQRLEHSLRFVRGVCAGCSMVALGGYVLLRELAPDSNR